MALAREDGMYLVLEGQTFDEVAEGRESGVDKGGRGLRANRKANAFQRSRLRALGYSLMFYM